MYADVSVTGKPARIVAIDVVRGLTIAAMLIVNDPGDASQVFATLRHSAWHGCTLADLVFPAFLLLVGVTTHLTLGQQPADALSTQQIRTIWRRGAMLIGIGLLINAYPFFEKNVVAGPTVLPITIQHVIARLASLRVMGVLQRIGIVYLAIAWPARRLSTRALIALVCALLLGYWVLLMYVPLPGANATGSIDVAKHTWPVWLDQRLLNWEGVGLGWHLWDRVVPYDPEGILSTLTAITTALIGVIGARTLTGGQPRAAAQRLSITALVMLSLGLLWQPFFPINKALWTSSFVLVTGGVTWLLIAMVMWIVDVRESRGWIRFLVVFGSNSIAVYVFSEFIASVLRSSIKWRAGERRVGTGEALVRLLEQVGVEPRAGSLIWALIFTALCYGFALTLYRRRLFLRL